LHEEITVDALNKRISKLSESSGNEEQISKIQGMIS
jgi:hypothetical protein